MNTSRELPRANARANAGVLAETASGWGALSSLSFVVVLVLILIRHIGGL